MRGLEEIAREKIDRLLLAAGWILQDRSEFKRTASLGVAVREFQLPADPCNYLLFVDGKASGVASEICGVGRPRLNLKDMHAFPVPLPPRIEQSAICERVIEAEMQVARLIGMPDRERTRSIALR